MTDNEVLHWSHALLRRESALAAIAALRSCAAQGAVEGLAELIYRGAGARETLAAIDALEGCGRFLVTDALLAALLSPNATVRLASVQALHRRNTPAGPAFTRLLRRDGSWPVRRAALVALADQRDERWEILHAATDPHWRVRYALLRVLLGWGQNGHERDEIQERLTRSGNDGRTEGVCAYLRWRWDGHPPHDGPGTEAPDPRERCAFW